MDDVPILKRGLVALARAHKAEVERIDSLPATMEGIVTQHIAQFVEEHLEPVDENQSSLPDDLEGIYKELDQLAELINKRDAVVDSSLERIETLERSVGRLRRNVERTIRQLTEAQGTPGDTVPREGRTAAPPDGVAHTKPALTAVEPLGGGLPAVDAALERARRRRDLSRRLD